MLDAILKYCLKVLGDATKGALKDAVRGTGPSYSTKQINRDINRWRAYDQHRIGNPRKRR